MQAIRRYKDWAITLLVALFGALLRLVRLGEPRALVFDETYYVKDAWTTLLTGEPRDWPEMVKTVGQNIPPDTLFAQGDTDHWLNSAEYVVHPPVGKWLIASGLKLFGGAGNPFAWRIATTIAGVVGIILLMRVALRLFHSTSISVLAGTLLAIDGVGITLSRTALLDNFIMVLALGAFSLLLIHRDHAYAKLEHSFAKDSASRKARWRVSTKDLAGATTSQTPQEPRAYHRPPRHTLLLDAPGPCLAWSWQRFGAVLLLGLATGVKWSGTYFFAVFLTLSVLWDAWNRRETGYYPWFRYGALRDGILTALYTIPLYGLTYLADWIPWFLHKDSYMRAWAASHPHEGISWLPQSLRSFVAYHQQMWQFHTTLDAPHNYKANPLTWPIQWRPTSFYWEKIDGHPGLCAISPRSQCVSSITSLGNPIIWWLACICMVTAIIIAICKHGDWRVWAVLSGLLAGWVPWWQYLNRTTFTFYSIVILPWMILGIAYLYNWMRESCSRTVYLSAYGITLGICTLVSIYFYPLWTAMPIPYEFWLQHMWFESWI